MARLVGVYGTCSVCGHRYALKVPRGGDGSELHPIKHSRRVGDRYYGAKETCPGSYRPAVEEKQK